MAVLNVAGAQLWFEDTGGTEPPVILVHPAAGSSASWVNQIPDFTDAGFRCITFDLRGWGRSKVPDKAPDNGYLSDDIRALADHLRLKKFSLVAAAYGGFGGMDFALRFQERLTSFVLATSQGGIADPDYVQIRDRVASAEVRAMPIEYRELGPSYRAESPEGVQEWLRILHDAGYDQAVRQKMFLSTSLPDLEQLNTPTLLLAGDADLLAPPALMRLMAERIPNVEFVTVAEAGHSAHWERPEEWNRQVLAFLQRFERQ